MMTDAGPAAPSRPGQPQIDSRRAHLTGLIGAGITHSLTPPLHEFAARACGLRYLYMTIDLDRLGLAPEMIGELVARAPTYGFVGLNLTYPVKQLVVPTLDDVDAHARRIGSVNTVVIDGGRCIGHNTDWTGFRSAMRSELPDVKLGSVIQIGAGGAGSAVAYALGDLGVRRLTIIDLALDRAEALAAQIRRLYPECDARAAGTEAVSDRLGQADGLVNTTPIGMEGHPGLPCDLTALERRHWVADVVYRPLRTELTLIAERRGCQVMGGGRMAVGQAVDSFALFTGQVPDEVAMLAHFEELIRAEARAGQAR